MSAHAPGGRMGAPVTEDTVCWNCPHQADEHIGAGGSCVAYVIQFGREHFCLCRAYVPDAADSQ